MCKEISNPKNVEWIKVSGRSLPVAKSKRKSGCNKC